jgi:hypothetical protein
MRAIRQPITLIFFGILLLLSAIPASAQTLDLQMSAEYDIGFDCPVSATFDPTATTLWVLMNNCGVSGFSVRGFNITDGSSVNDEASSFTDELTLLNDPYFYSNTPIAFTPDGVLDIFYNAGDDYDTFNVRVPVDPAATPGREMTLLNLETVNNLIPGYSGYLETNAYNADHTLAVVIDTLTYHIIDLQTGEVVLAIDEPGGTDITFPSFSQDGQRLYIARFSNPDNFDDYSGTLSIYSLPDGALLQTYEVPSALLWVSPNEQYAAFTIGSSTGDGDTLGVVELATGAVSPILEINEPSSKLMACANDGRDMSDVDFTVSGRLPVQSLNWLPDSSGFLTVNSYGGEAAGGGRTCFFNYSRLRQYSVG